MKREIKANVLCPVCKSPFEGSVNKTVLCPKCGKLLIVKPVDNIHHKSFICRVATLQNKVMAASKTK